MTKGSACRTAYAVRTAEPHQGKSRRSVRLQVRSGYTGDGNFITCARSQKRLNPQKVESNRVHLRKRDDTVHSFQPPRVFEIFAQQSLMQFLAKFLHLIRRWPGSLSPFFSSGCFLFCRVHRLSRPVGKIAE